MLSKLLLAFAVLLAILGVVVSRQPDEFIVARSVIINAPAEKVFPHINDHHNWEAWSPWAKLDPNMKSEITGAAAGQGSVYSWKGSAQVGEGISTIVESRPNELVKMKLEFLKPFKCVNDVEFSLRQEGSQTVVTWRMSGKANFISKIMSLFMNCEKMMNGQFDQGLAKLKEIVEKS